MDNEIPDDRESQRLVLRGILSGRTNGFAPHWKSLRAFGEWPESTEQDVMLEGVRAVNSSWYCAGTPGASATRTRCDLSSGAGGRDSSIG